MKQAILITAYRDLERLKRIVDSFDSCFEFYIHIDKKCKERIDALFNYKYVHIYKKYKIEWGGVNHLNAILFLVEEASKNTDLGYFHLITGSDLPIRSLFDFKTYFENHSIDNYLEYFKLPRESWDGEGGLIRIKYYWIRPNLSRVKGWGSIVRFLLRVQRKLKIYRNFNFFDGNIYGGGTYWSVSREAINTLLNYIRQNPRYMKRFRWTSISEEICFPTIWLNSDLTFINNSLRYIDWDGDKQASSPKILTEKDYDQIKTSKCFFARKFEKGVSDRLIEMLNKK